MIFNKLEKTISELENEILEENLELFFESYKEDCLRIQEAEQVKLENFDQIYEIYEPIQEEKLAELWRQSLNSYPQDK